MYKVPDPCGPIPPFRTISYLCRQNNINYNMMHIEQQVTGAIAAGVRALYGAEITAGQIALQKTKKEFKGHLTLVVFPLLRISKKPAGQTAAEIGQYVVKHLQEVVAYNVINGFLNLTVASGCWVRLLEEISRTKRFGTTPATEASPLVMIEYSSPNTNKPLHLGHVRNNLLGYSLSEIMKANGYRVIKTNIINDRGIHICKSMLAWSKWGNGATPQSAGKKGDHLVGEYYVLFDKHYKQEIEELQA